MPNIYINQFTDFDFKHLSELEKVPNELTESIFLQFFERAKIANFSPDEYKSYETSLKYYRDLKNSLDTAKEEGVIAGRIEGRFEREIEIAKNLKSLGLDIETIKKATGLSQDEILKL